MVSKKRTTTKRVTRTKKIQKWLQELLADEFVIFSKTLQAHWNISSIHFHSLHELLEEQYNEQLEAADMLAERLRILGYEADGRLQRFVNDTTLVHAAEPSQDPSLVLNSLLADHVKYVKLLKRRIRGVPQSYNDPGTEDMLTEVLRMHEKQLWQLRESVQL